MIKQLSPELLIMLSQEGLVKHFNSAGRIWTLANFPIGKYVMPIGFIDEHHYCNPEVENPTKVTYHYRYGDGCDVYLTLTRDAKTNTISHVKRIVK